QAQHVASSLLGGDEEFHLVGKHHQPDAVVVVNGGKGHQGTKLDGQFAFELLARAEIERATGIDGQQDGEFALFDEALYVGKTAASRYIPVDGTDVVALSIGAHLVELHAAPLEDRVILTRHGVINHAARGDLNLADAGGYFLVDQHTSPSLRNLGRPGNTNPHSKIYGRA